MPLITKVVGNNTIMQPVIYKDIPFYASIWFWLGVFAIFIGLVFTIYQWIKYRQKNRLVVRVHNPDLSIDTYVYRKFQGDVFHLPSKELTSEGEQQFFDYHFKNEYVERGLWGKYIDYDYGILEPINPKARLMDVPQEIPQIIKFLEAITNTKLLSELLLNSKFKDFVTLMLWFILIAGILSILGHVASFIQASNIHAVCTLDNSNQTIAVIKSALGQNIVRQ